MVGPVVLADFFTIFFSSAMVIVMGALYALLFAYSRIKKQQRLMLLAYAAYFGLFISAVELARTMHLFSHPVWAAVVLLMLTGYLLAPHGIWHLCVSTHNAEQAEGRPFPVKNS